MSHAWGDPALRLMANHDLSQFAATEGSIEVFIAPERPPGAAHWIKSDPDSRTNFFLVREAFYDWSEEPSHLDIQLCTQRVEGGIDMNEAESVRRLEAAIKLIQFCWDYFGGGFTQSVFDKAGVNSFYYVDTSTGRDGSHPAAGFVPAIYEIAADEALVMGLRLSEGIDAGAIARRFGLESIVDWARVDRMVGLGHLSRNGERIAVTPGGRLLLEAILGEIAAPISEVSEPTPESPTQSVSRALSRAEQPLAAPVPAYSFPQ